MTKSVKERHSVRKKEGYYKEALKMNVRARSYFKIEQINNKFKILKENQKILDLGSAPGGWLEYLDKELNKAQIVGIDLLEIKKQHEFSDKIQIIEDDFNNLKEYNLGEFDLIVSDMAPEFSGDSFADKGRTHKLNVITIDFSKEYLRKGGNLIMKSFEGEDIQFVRNVAKNYFEIVKDYKPKSSQNKSAEVFIICLNKL